MLYAADGHNIRVHTWYPDSPALRILHILHGLGEHAGRYAEFAAAANARGWLVCCHDHRGHGSFADKLGYFADSDGWQLLLSDTFEVQRHLQEQSPQIPVHLIGHSMGSFIAQAFAMLHGDNLGSLLLSASTWPSRLELRSARLLAQFEAWRIGRQNRSALLQKIGFEKFNQPFRPGRTELDWLSRDAAEVDKYIADPLCGGPYTCSLWLDLIDGLFAITAAGALQQIPESLPILITGGAADPVGGERGMQKLAARYRKSGHTKVQIKTYPGGRHEMLHDTLRTQVAEDWLTWMEAVPTSRSADSG